jgi:hypothetical protein
MRARNSLTHCAARFALLARGFAGFDRLGFAMLSALAIGACVVSDFDRVRQASLRRDAGPCLTASGAVDEGCEAVEVLDAEADESELDAASEEADAGAARDEGGVDAGGAGGAGGADADGSASATLMCGDTVSDAKNCGRCGIDCSAGGARVSCENGRCYRACADGFGDCNGDLVLGMMGNGCELRIDSDSANCGECRRRCLAPKDGFATCAKQQCSGHRLLLSAPLPGETFGSLSGGNAYSLQCPEGQVATGIEGIGDTVAYGLGVRCASLKVTQESGQLTVSLGATTSTSAVGGLISGPPPAYRLSCPAGMVISAVSGTLWNYPGATVTSVKTLTITCSGLRLTDQKVGLTAGSSLTIGTPEQPPLVTFARNCPAPGAVSGFSGRAGAYIDAISVHCGKLTLQEELAGSVTVAASVEGVQLTPAP